MTLESYLAFLLAAQIVVLIPGPTVMLILSYALARGRGTTAGIVAGVALGDLVAVTASVLGVGALLAASAEAFTVLRVLGALYLIYLGSARCWPPPGLPSAPAPAAGSAGTGAWPAFGHAFVVTALNPKSIVFFVAFLPQFVVPGSAAGPQLALLAAGFLVVGTLNAVLYASLGAALAQRIRTPRTLRWIQRIGGTALIGAGAAALAAKRAA